MRELDFLVEGPEGLDDRSTRHLASPLARRDYVRIADQTVRQMCGSRLLDWGCGYGQLSYLLAARGLDVASYDVGPAMHDERVPLAGRLRAVHGEHPYQLPFRAGSFDGVLACGVLEHVADVGRSLDELHRVLVPGGRLLVYNLPNRYSYKEALIRRLGAGYTHERRYTKASIGAVLGEHGFGILAFARAGVLPFLGTGLPPRARRLYDRLAAGLFPVDRILSRTPAVNLVAQSLEVVAERS